LSSNLITLFWGPQRGGTNAGQGGIIHEQYTGAHWWTRWSALEDTLERIGGYTGARWWTRWSALVDTLERIGGHTDIDKGHARGERCFVVQHVIVGGQEGLVLGVQRVADEDDAHRHTGGTYAQETVQPVGAPCA
jgi:hypothetical protein